VSGGAASICLECHAQGRGCCTLGSAGSGEMFPLTWPEVQAICRATGRRAGDFVAADRPAQAFLDFAAALNPLLIRCMPGGVRLRLRVKDGGCCLLGPQGCLLPVEVRPCYCRLYPFFLTPGGRLMVLLSERCLAQEGARGWREVLARLGGSEAELRAIFAQYEQASLSHQARPGPLVSHLLAGYDESHR
jgi:Fe-S-cluster containining protein